MSASADAVAIIAAVGGVVSTIAGVTLAVRAARSKERKANKEEVTQLSTMLNEEREARIAAELERHKLKLMLAEHGIDPDDP